MSNGDAADPRRVDDPEARGESDLARLGIPSSLFGGILDESIAHATLAGRADALAATRPWVPIGPRNVGGRIRALCQHPTDARTLYAGSGLGGLWKTTDGGDTWRSLDDFRPPNPPANVPQALPIGAIGIARSNPQTLYVGTGEPVLTKGDLDYQVPGSGLYRSTDGGVTLEQIDHPDVLTGTIASRNFERIRVDPWEARRLWVASPTRGLWRGHPVGAPALAPAFAQDVVDAAGAPAAPSQRASDVVVDFGDPSGAPPATYTVYAALRGHGIFRATFDRATNAYVGAPAWTKLTSGDFPEKFHRVKLAVCESVPSFVYAIFALDDNEASRVFVSEDRGARWRKTAGRPGDGGKQAWYDLVLEVHPQRPDVIFTASVDLFRTLDAGASWKKVMDWTKYDGGDRAQHADHHAFVFDVLEPRRVWVGNDGGISTSVNLGETWRKRSHGILATQLTDVTVHPVFPFVTGGGLQDNGTWVSYGGPTWYHLFGGDGGDIGFEPGDERRFHVTSQGGVLRASVGATTGESDYVYRNPVPDYDAATTMRAEVEFLDDGFDGDDKPPFYAVIEHHPSHANELLVGRKRAAYRTTDGKRFSKLSLGSFKHFTPAGIGPITPEVSALAFAPSAPDTDWWVGTSRGELFVTTNGGGAWRQVAPVAIRGSWVSAIAVHPANPNIVAVAVAARTGAVYLSAEQGANWLEISGRSPLAPSVAPSDRLSPSPITAVAFDPASPALAGSAQTLYAGTLAGVEVIRNAIAPLGAPPVPPAPPAFRPVWRAFNNGLPLVLLFDIAPVVVRDAASAPVRTLLRCATFGRGVYECDLGGAPAVRLLIRGRAIDDGRSYEGAAGALFFDPRLAFGTPMSGDRAIDIRVDAPPFESLRQFGDSIDGVEFDEHFRSSSLVAGERNAVYVQVHNVGSTAANGVEVHVFFANAAGEPPLVPDLPAAFWDPATFPTPPAGDWRLAGSMTVGGLSAAQPRVLRLLWDVPRDVAAQVAVLAVATHPALDDVLGPPAPPLVVDSSQAPGLVRTERRAALRVVDVASFAPDPFVRDDTGDDGSAGAVAWGGRSADIIVTAAVVADPDAEFANRADRRSDDRVRGGVENRVHVRVHNRRSLPIEDVEVVVFEMPLATLFDGKTWRNLGTAQAKNVPAKGAKLTGAVVWPAPPDPNPLGAHKVYLLAALVGTAGDPRASPADVVSDGKTFWELFAGAERQNNAALRGLIWEPA